MSTSDITTTVAIATGIPATFDKAGYEALTWVQIKGIVSVGAIGVTDAITDVPNLETGFTKGVKGARVGDVISMPIAQVTGDPGQVAAEAAAAGFTEYSFRINEPGPLTQYFSGLPMNWKRNERSTSSYAGYNLDVRLNYVPVTAADA